MSADDWTGGYLLIIKKYYKLRCWIFIGALKEVSPATKTDRCNNSEMYHHQLYPGEVLLYSHLEPSIFLGALVGDSPHAGLDARQAVRNIHSKMRNILKCFIFRLNPWGIPQIYTNYKVIYFILKISLMF